MGIYLRHSGHLIDQGRAAIYARYRDEVCILDLHEAQDVPRMPTYIDLILNKRMRPCVMLAHCNPGTIHRYQLRPIPHKNGEYPQA